MGGSPCASGLSETFQNINANSNSYSRESEASSFEDSRADLLLLFVRKAQKRGQVCPGLSGCSCSPVQLLSPLCLLVAHLGNADMIQPGLIPLQPNFDFMDTFEPFQGKHMEQRRGPDHLEVMVMPLS